MEEFADETKLKDLLDVPSEDLVQVGEPRIGVLQTVDLSFMCPERDPRSEFLPNYWHPGSFLKPGRNIRIADIRSKPGAEAMQVFIWMERIVFTGVAEGTRFAEA